VKIREERIIGIGWVALQRRYAEIIYTQVIRSGARPYSKETSFNVGSVTQEKD